MPAGPKPKPKAPPQLVQSAGKQEDFVAAAVALAAKLGWEGEPDWVQLDAKGNVVRDITVKDAQNYIAKTMHEHFQAAALKLPQPAYQAACEHLAVDTPAEQKAIDEALALAYEAGKGAAVKSVAATTAGLTAALDMGAAHGLGKLTEAEVKAKG